MGWRRDAGEMRGWHGGEGGVGSWGPCTSMGENGGFQEHLLQLAKMLLSGCPQPALLVQRRVKQ